MAQPAILSPIKPQIQLPGENIRPGYTQSNLTQIQVSTGYRLYTPAQAGVITPSAGLTYEALPEKSRRQLQAAMRWIENFIMQPHPRLGRAGVVCPYVKPCLDANIFYLSLAPMKQPERYDEIFRMMHTHARIFSRMEPRTGPLENLRVLMALVPNGRDSVLSDPELSKRLKTEMMERNVTIGQFFPTLNPIKYVKSKFFPNQPPFCMYTMRTFIRSDWMFIQNEPEWRQVYLDKFGTPPERPKEFTL
jgi:hypothetical protein